MRETEKKKHFVNTKRGGEKIGSLNIWTINSMIKKTKQMCHVTDIYLSS